MWLTKTKDVILIRVLLCFLFLGFTSSPNTMAVSVIGADAIDVKHNFSTDRTANTVVVFVNYIILDRGYIGFKEAIAFKESQGRYTVVNSLGYLGKYQFGASTLKLIGINNPSNFLNNPVLQEKAFLANAKRNKWILRRDIKRFSGQRINGTLVTESGILAAAHLSGPGNVKRYLRSYGAVGFSDAFGTDIESYMRKFSSYNTSFITAEKRPRVNFQ